MQRPVNRRRYQVVAGSSIRRGGRADLVGTFDDETRARAAFVALRLRAKDENDWGELAVVPDGGDARVLCWFGESRPVPSGTSVATATRSSARPNNPAKRWLLGSRRRRRVATEPEDGGSSRT